MINDLHHEADSYTGFMAWGWLSMGQLLSLPLIVAGMVILYFADKKKEATSI